MQLESDCTCNITVGLTDAAEHRPWLSTVFCKPDSHTVTVEVIVVSRHLKESGTDQWWLGGIDITTYFKLDFNDEIRCSQRCTRPQPSLSNVLKCERSRVLTA